jgi:hypothetical protein
LDACAPHGRSHCDRWSRHVTLEIVRLPRTQPLQKGKVSIVSCVKSQLPNSTLYVSGSKTLFCTTDWTLVRAFGPPKGQHPLIPKLIARRLINLSFRLGFVDGNVEREELFPLRTSKNFFSWELPSYDHLYSCLARRLVVLECNQNIRWQSRPPRKTSEKWCSSTKTVFRCCSRTGPSTSIYGFHRLHRCPWSPKGLK